MRTPNIYRIIIDPKHAANLAKQFYIDQNIDWWKTPAESPDINPIELIWAEMKQFLRMTVKPECQADLVQGCRKFWRENLDKEKCSKYIDHLYKVIPKVIELKGHPTGY